MKGENQERHWPTHLHGFWTIIFAPTHILDIWLLGIWMHALCAQGTHIIAHLPSINIIQPNFLTMETYAVNSGLFDAFLRLEHDDMYDGHLRFLSFLTSDNKNLKGTSQ